MSDANMKGVKVKQGWRCICLVCRCVSAPGTCRSPSTPTGVQGSRTAGTLAGGEGSGLCKGQRLCLAELTLMSWAGCPLRGAGPKKSDPWMSPCSARGARLRIPALANRIPNGEHRKNFARRNLTALLFPAPSPGLPALQAGHTPWQTQPQGHSWPLAPFMLPVSPWERGLPRRWQ